MPNWIKNTVTKRIFTVVSFSLLVLGVLVNLVALKVSSFQWSVDYVNQIMVSYIIIGLFFLIFENRFLVVTAFLCAASLALLMKETTNARIKSPLRNNQPKFRVSLCNISDIDSDPDKVFSYILKNDPDIVVFEEFTPDWESVINEKMASHFSLKVQLPRIDAYGLLIFSKLNTLSIDTFYYEQYPIVRLNCKIYDKLLNTYCTYISPNIDKGTRDSRDGQLNFLEKLVSMDSTDKVVTGVFNTVAWAAELQDFRSNTGLSNSRNGYVPTVYTNSGGFFNRPLTHIFYSTGLECISFMVNRADNDEFGVQSTFQFKNRQ